MANWWEDENFSNQMLALGMGLLQGSGPSTDPANRSFGAALGKGGMALLEQMQRDKTNKMNERRLGMEEKTLAMKQAELEQQIAAAQAAAEQQRVFRGKLTGEPADLVASGGDTAGGPPLKVTQVPAIPVDPTFEAMLSPAQRKMLREMPYDKAAAMAEKLMETGETKFYSVPGSNTPVALRQTKGGIYLDESGKPFVANGIQPYKPQEYVTVSSGLDTDPSMRVEKRVPANQEWTGKPFKSSGPSINVNTGEKKAEELTLKQALDWSEKYVAQRPILQSVVRMEQASKDGTFTGLTAQGAMGAVSFLNGIGVNVAPETFANSRAFQASGNQLALDFMAANGGARGFTEKETKMLLDAFPKIADSVEARKQIFEIMRSKSAQIQSTYQGMYNRMKENNPDAAKYLEPPVPLNIGNENKPYDQVKSGEVYMAPDGKLRRKK